MNEVSKVSRPFKRLKKADPPGRRKLWDEIEARLGRVKKAPGEWFMIMSWANKVSAYAYRNNHREQLAALSQFEFRTAAVRDQPGSALYARYIPTEAATNSGVVAAVNSEVQFPHKKTRNKRKG